MMNYFRKITTVFVFCFLCSLTAQAQRGGGDPIETANRQTQRMTDSLTLSTAQATKVSEINLKYANKMAEMRKAARESGDMDREAMRENIGKMRAEQKLELQKILTKDQWTKFEKMELAREKSRESGRGGKGEKREKGKKEQKVEKKEG